MTPPRICAAGVLAAALTIAGCGGSSSTHPAGTTAPPAAPAAAAPASAITIAIRNYAYAPATLTVKPGAKVTFINHDATAHTATASATPGFDTGSITANGQATVTLTKPGTYSYICQFHPFMKATITVG